MRSTDWNLTAVSIYESGLTQQHQLHPSSYRMYGVRLNGARPIVMSVPERMLDQLYTSCDYAIHPKVDRSNILTHSSNGPDMDRINKIVYPNDNELY